MDYFVFILIVLAGFAALYVWMCRWGGLRRPPLWPCLALLCLLVAGWFYTQAAGHKAALQIRQMLEGFPPTYAQELERMGHAAITTETSTNDPAYLAIIEAQLRWQRVNPLIADIYTLRKLPDGRNILVVDSETDYDRNGKFEGDREDRTPIGEVYAKNIPALEKAFAGTASFTDEPYSDRWGVWVSAFVPLHDAQGRVEAVVGVDYPGKSWLLAISRARLNAITELSILAVLLAASATVIALLRADLHNRRLAEEKVSRLNHQLEQRVLERTAQLEATHQKLLEASRAAGIAEGATGALHNVGNVLNSINVASSCVLDSLKRSRSADLSKVAALLRDHQAGLEAFLTSDPKGKQLPVFISQLAARLSDERAAMLKDLSELQKHIDHVKGIVRIQQSFARISETAQTLNLGDLIDDALTINASALARREIRVVREFEAIPALTVEKNKVLQILVNLVRNAQQACDESACRQKVLTLRLTSKPNHVCVAVQDNGIGILAENLPRIFAHGFTTKKDGHGFGLHSGALTAKELGGSLKAASDGPGKGATFTLELPLTPSNHL